MNEHTKRSLGGDVKLSQVEIIAILEAISHTFQRYGRVIFFTYTLLPIMQKSSNKTDVRAVDSGS